MMTLRSLLAAFIAGLILSPSVRGQSRDYRAERIVLDDNAADGGLNTITIQAPNPLLQDVALTIPDPGVGTAEILLGPSGSGGPWFLTGNAGTTAGTNFIGTSDVQALHLYVNGGSGANSNSLILNTTGSMQRDIGGNARGVGAVDLSISRSAVTQVASAQAATIGGGADNTASSLNATVSGGTGNTASGQATTVGGGSGNTASGNRSTVGGGIGNTASGTNTSIPGGRGLTLAGAADGSFGFLGGNSGANDMTISTPDVAAFGNTDLWLANNNNSASALRFYEAYNTSGAFPNTANYTAFVAGTQTADITYTLPTSPPASNGQLLASTTGGVMSWTADAELASLRLNGAPPVTNSRLVVNEGHWTSQGTAPTAVGDGTNLAAGVTVAGTSTDVVGNVSATDGGGVGTGVITVTFNAAYSADPVVLIVPTNATAANSSYFINNTTTTSFDLNVGTTSGNGTDTYQFNYMVIEAD